MKTLLLAGFAALGLMLAPATFDSAKASDWKSTAVNNNLTLGVGQNLHTRVSNGVNVGVGNQTVGANASASASGYGTGAPALANNLKVTGINNGITIGLGTNVGTSFHGVTGANLSNTTVGAASSINVSSTARVH
ncbi:MAG: hypothetical protein INF43_03720 [Alphaproteobacteria bacterium]|jgi:hypothetical protein|nr:hypothetical protein [Alphaproteobacteria bacterium]